MPVVNINKNDRIMMMLVHYFVTKENYAPINVQGVKDEVWLENLEGPYRVIRINSHNIFNNEQYDYDLFRIKYILKQIKKKTLSFKINALNICLDMDNRVDRVSKFNINTIKLDNMDEIKNNEYLIGAFPNIKDGLIDPKDNIDLIINVTNDINEKTIKNNKLFEKVFSPKKIVVTKVIMFICIIMFILMYVIGKGSTNIPTLVAFGANSLDLIKAGEIWRLLTCTFLHIGFMHLLLNMYSLAIIGNEVETLIGKMRYLFIYIMSALCGSLLSIISISSDTISAGASGAIFGLLGSLLYFGYHYRLYLNDALRNQIIPIIVLNLVIGFMIPGIDVFCHIGGLIGGYLATMAIGLEGKSTKKDMLNGWITLSIYIAFLSYVVFFIK